MIAFILMNTDELTQITTAHHAIISRHDVEMAEIRAVLRESADKHTQHEQELTAHEATMQKINDTLARTAAQQEANAQQIALNREDIASLTAGILDLRNLVADYSQGCADH